MDHPDPIYDLSYPLTDQVKLHLLLLRLLEEVRWQMLRMTYQLARWRGYHCSCTTDYHLRHCLHHYCRLLPLLAPLATTTAMQEQSKAMRHAPGIVVYSYMYAVWDWYCTPYSAQITIIGEFIYSWMRACSCLEMLRWCVGNEI